MAQDHSAKTLFWTLLNTTLVIVMVLGLIATGTLIRYSNAIVPSRTITITGQGKTQITPDIATYSFSVVTQGADPEKVQRDNTDKMNKAISFVKSENVDDADIKTTGYNLYPRYNYDRNTGRSTIDGYELTQTVTIKIRDLDNVGALLSGLVRAGVNQAGSLQYSIEHPDQQRAQARREAFANAYTKAREMASQNGVQLARVITFSENAGYDGPIFYGEKSMAVGMGGDAIAPSPVTQPGSEEVTINVSVVYEIR